MSFSHRLSFSDFDNVTAGADSLRDESLRVSSWISVEGDTDTEDLGYLAGKDLSLPSSTTVENFKASNYRLSSSSSLVSSSSISSRYDLNWTSVDSYVSNWHLLSDVEKDQLNKLLSSDVIGNPYRYGLKTKNLETHLLLNIGCDMNNIVANGEDSVLSNLRKDDGTLYNSLNTRAVDARTCRRATMKFKKTHNVERLFNTGLVAFQAVVTLNEDERVSGSLSSRKQRYQEFFKSNAKEFARLSNKKKDILSYIYSHEISVDSIIEGKYRPHTHIIFFVESGYLSKSGVSEVQHSVEAIEEAFNSRFSDRSISTVKTEIDSVFYPKMVCKYEDIEKSIDYLGRCYSLADQYMREIREENVRDLNKATVECYRNLIWFFKSEEANGLKGVRVFNSSRIPLAKDKGKYKHPLLQSTAKKIKIRKIKISTTLGKGKKHAKTQQSIEGTTEKGSTDASTFSIPSSCTRSACSHDEGVVSAATYQTSAELSEHGSKQDFSDKPATYQISNTSSNTSSNDSDESVRSTSNESRRRRGSKATRCWATLDECWGTAEFHNAVLSSSSSKRSLRKWSKKTSSYSTSCGS